MSQCESRFRKFFVLVEKAVREVEAGGEISQELKREITVNRDDLWLVEGFAKAIAEQYARSGEKIGVGFM